MKIVVNLTRSVSLIAVVATTAWVAAHLDATVAHAQHWPGMGQHRDWWMPGWMHRREWSPRGMGPEMRARMQRHWTYMHDGVPKEYAGARSNVSTTPETVVDGGRLYAAQCASCHGKTGMGDGQAGKSLMPSPALLAYLIQRPIAADEYLLWSISEGGKPFATAMPAFKDTLSREEILSDSNSSLNSVSELIRFMSDLNISGVSATNLASLAAPSRISGSASSSSCLIVAMSNFSPL